VKSKGSKNEMSIPEGMAIPPSAMARFLYPSPNQTEDNLAGALCMKGYPIAAMIYPRIKKLKLSPLVPTSTLTQHPPIVRTLPIHTAKDKLHL
jgi:hypothetical protein